MTFWFNARELAEMKLAGLPVTESGLIRLAKREHWPSRKRESHGGGCEHPLIALPPQAQADYEERQRKEARKQELQLKKEANQQELSLVPVIQLKARQRSIMEARAAVIMELERRLIDEGGTGKAIQGFLNDFAIGNLHQDLLMIIEKANDKSRSLCRATLYNWYSAYKKGGVTALAPKVTKEKDPEPEWVNDFLRYYGKKQKPFIKEALRDWGRSEPERALPSYDQVKRYWRQLPDLVKMRGRYGVLAIRNIMAYKMRDVSHLSPASVYVADGKTFDAEVAHPKHGQPFKPEITTIIDARTRRIVGWSVALAENAFAVTDALRMACCEVSIPAIFYSDNGPGYKNKMMDAGLTGFLARLSITPSHSWPYNSQARGVVERVHHLWNEGARRLHTYLNKQMDKQEANRIHKLVRRELKEKGHSKYLLEWHGFIELIDELVKDYNSREHSGLPKIWDHDLGRKRHVTPNELWQHSVSNGWEPVPVDVYEADDLFRPWEVRPVRRCMIELYTNSYFAEELNAYHNKKVIVAFDIHDASKVWVRELDTMGDEIQPGKLICIAQFEGNKTAYYPQSYVKQKEEQRVKGLIRRREAHVEIAKQERHNLLIEHQPIVPVMDIVSSMSEALTVEVSLSSNVPPVVTKTEARFGPNGRPIFSNDEDYATWLLQNPQTVNDRDVEYLTDLLTSHTSKNLLRMAGVNLDALRSLVTNAAA